MTTIPPTKTARQARIAELLAAAPVRSQAELAGLLAADGLQVTQATLSRDLVELGAVRVRNAEGELAYAVAEDPTRADGGRQGALDLRLVGLCRDLLVAAEANGDLVVLRTPPGAAQFFASVIDQSALPPIMGTIAGDDTILLVCRAGHSGQDLAARFLDMAR